MGGHPDTAAHPPAEPCPPASILYVSNSVAPDMDELTHIILEWGGVSGSGSCQMQQTQQSQQTHHSHGGSQMDWMWRTATETHVDNVQTLFLRFIVKFPNLIP